jgi:hypothetical protein
MSIAAILLGLILATMVVLVRRASYEPDDAEWFDEDDYEDDEDDYYDEDDEDETSAAESSPPPQVPPAVQPIQNTQPVVNKPSLPPNEITRLSTEAGRLGVMQAIVPSQQGASGWYVDVSGEIQYWNVGADGSWTRGA